MLHLVLFVLTPLLVRAHYNLMWPPTRVLNPSGVPDATASVFPALLDGAGGCQNFECLWLNQGCQPGCSACTDKVGKGGMAIAPANESVDTCSEPGGTMSPTLNDIRLRTYRDSLSNGDWTKHNPWRSPGFSPVFSPCGLAGGGATPGDWNSESLQEHIRAGTTTPPFIKRGWDGRDLPEGPKTKWEQGSVQEVAWSIFLNHGGGYAYRLCPKSGNLTEECFQKHHLEFASDTTWIQYGDDKTNRTGFPAMRISEGTFPKGSTWTKNPIPPCMAEDQGPSQQASYTCDNPMFEPPLPGLFGDGPGSCVSWGIHGPVEGYHSLYDTYGKLVYQAPCTKEEALKTAFQFQFNIFDEVVVPKELPVGEYVLSFRLDSEQTPQVWTHCADITVTPQPAPSPGPSPTPSDSRFCKDHLGCAHLHPIDGLCCPVAYGTHLACCNNGSNATKPWENVEHTTLIV